ncbi:hypothetical protein BHU16_10595 [Tannerella sp. oral taxon 808]|nr:hypothetical protein BHU16_10595 [Tannerella sp. oral taxon 808]
MERFNSRRSECCPMYYGDKYDQLYFNSTRGIVHKDSLNAITGLKNNAFFLVKKDENGAWQKPKEVDDPVASEYDQGTPSFSKDGNTMYYTYCAVDATEPRTAEIYLSTRSGAAWSKGQRADIIKDSLTLLAHPAASPDGKYLYFVADAVGGVEALHTSHPIERGVLTPTLGRVASLDGAHGAQIGGGLRQVFAVILHGLVVSPLLLADLPEVEGEQAVGVVVTLGIEVGACGASGVVRALVAIPHAVRNVSAEVPLRRFRFGVEFTIHRRRSVVFT